MVPFIRDVGEERSKLQDLPQAVPADAGTNGLIIELHQRDCRFHSCSRSTWLVTRIQDMKFGFHHLCVNMRCQFNKYHQLSEAVRGFSWANNLFVCEKHRPTVFSAFLRTYATVFFHSKPFGSVDGCGESFCQFSYLTHLNLTNIVFDQIRSFGKLWRIVCRPIC